VHFVQLRSSSKKVKRKRKTLIKKKRPQFEICLGPQNSWVGSGLKHSGGAKKVVWLSPKKGATLPALQTYSLFGYQQYEK
jgi:hypothetical protein